MDRALILGRRNGVGLDQDSALLARALAENGTRVLAPRVRNFIDRFSGKYDADAAFHLERVAPMWRGKVAQHFLIPNQERFPHRLIPQLKMVDRVLCKSRHAEEIFSKHHSDVRLIGFTSQDRFLKSVLPDYSRFFHLAGRSTLKNTSLLLELWGAHPQWPRLTLVQHPDNAPRSVPTNVELHRCILTSEELRLLQNICGIHLCPSLSEGWGHYIVEAMSCAAVTVTTAAPPMEELVGNGRGFTVRPYRSEPRHLGENFHADPIELAAVIEGLIAMPVGEKAAIGQAARAWFLVNDQGFSARLRAALA